MVGMLPQSQVEGGWLVVAPYNYASTFEDRRKVVQNNPDLGASVGNKR